MLEAFGDHPQGQSLHFGHGFGAVVPVAEHARQGRHLGKPAATVFPLKLDREGHESTLHPDRLPNKRLRPAAARRIMRPPRLKRVSLGL